MSLTFDMPPTSPALDELMSRAGASDTDREAWLAQRMSGITATQVRDLHLGVLRVQDLVDLKLGRTVDTFTGNQYTEWGNKREPMLAEGVQWAYGIAPESRVFHAADNPRFLASPDGVGVGPDGSLRVGEYKTTNTAIPVGSFALAKKGYIAQMVWAMRVTGATRCLFRWEQHNNDWVDVGGRYPEPSGIVTTGDHWIDYDAELAAELEVIAVEFLAELDRQRGGAAPVHDPEDYEVLVAAYLENQRRADEYKARADEVKAQIEERSGRVPGFKVVTSLASVTYVAPAPRQLFDPDAWARKAPAQHRAWQAALEKYTRSVPVKASMRITPKKDKETTE